MASLSSSANSPDSSQKHPRGLPALFFTEMWERLAFYLMVGILLLYCTDNERGGLGMTLGHATEVYGTYYAFVYFTPFLGGLIADRFLGYRRSVLIGGLFMAAGLFTMGVRGVSTLYAGLALICIGNGLFKPNISAMVGNLYERGDPKKDAGFNIFYMGINLGAVLSALLSAPLRNMFSFNIAFVGAGVGLLIGVTILMVNWKMLGKADRPPERDPRDVGFGTILLTILLPAIVFGVAGYYIGGKIELIATTIKPVTFGFIMGMIPVLGYFISLVVKAAPDERPGLASLVPVFVAGGAFFMILHLSGGLMTRFTELRTSREAEWAPGFLQKYYAQKAMPSYYDNADADLPRPPEGALAITDAETEAMFGAKRISEQALAEIQRAYADVKVLDADDDLAKRWSFLECKVYKSENIVVKSEKDKDGKVTSISVQLKDETKPAERRVLLARDSAGATIPVLLVTQETFDSVYRKAGPKRLPGGAFISVFNAELFTSLLNPLFVVAFTPLVVGFFAWRIRNGKPMGTPKKMIYGMSLTFISLLIMAAGANAGGDGASKVSSAWLIVYYVVITFGELFLSPVGLSLVTKLSPKRLVGLMMGGWFVSTAVGNKLSGFISGLPPTTTMFIILSLAPLAVAVLILVCLPMLNRALKQYGA